MTTSRETNGLTIDALSKSLLVCSDRAASTKAFVASQMQHASIYAMEGKKLVSRWKKDSGTEINTCETAPNTTMISVRGGFSSPVLKPRNAKCPSVVQLSTHAPLVYPPVSEVNSTRKPPGRGKERNPVQVQLDKISTNRSESSVPDSPKVKSGIRRPKPCKKTERKKRNRSDSDDEREELLAQRRARRQRKKEIVAPKARSENPASDSDAEAEQPDTSEKKKSKKMTGKTKLPAGLALMHGFSAGNIGKHRLTIEPAATFGVFNKGRASTKTKVEKKLKQKAPVQFDESGFLNKITLPFTLSCVSKPLPKHANATDSDASNTSKGHKDTPRNQKLAIATKTSSLHLAGSSETLPSVSSKKGRSVCDDKSNYQSEVWEIEKEFLYDACDDQRSTKLVEAGSIVINSRAWAWGAAEASERADDLPEVRLVSKGEPDNDSVTKSVGSHVGSATSLTPSQSASQIPVRFPDFPDTPQLKSKFFASPKQNKGAEEAVLSGKRDLSPLPEPDPARHSQIGQDMDSARTIRVQKIDAECADIQEGAPIQYQGSECRSFNASSFSLEEAIRKLEAEDLGPLATQYNALSRRPRLSSIEADFAFEEQPGTAPVLQHQTDTDLAVTDDAHDYQYYYDTFNAYDMADAHSEDARAESGDLALLSSGCTQGIYDQVLGENGSGLDDVYLSRDAQEGGDCNYAKSVYSMDLDYEPPADEAPFGCYNSLSRTEYGPDGDYGGGSYAPDDWNGSSYSYHSDVTCDEDYFENSEDIQEVGQQTVETGTPENFFLEGRAMLFGRDILEGQLDSMDQSTLAEASRQIGSLRDAEAAVAKDFRNRFYPIRF